MLTAETRIGGASAGSLAAACYHSGLPEKTVTDACLVLCDDCRRNGTRGRLRHVLKLFLEKCGLHILKILYPLVTNGDIAWMHRTVWYTATCSGSIAIRCAALMRRLLPADIHQRCSGKAYVAVTTVFPRPRGLLVSEFSSRDDLIAALLTSCHIPWSAVHPAPVLTPRGPHHAWLIRPWTTDCRALYPHNTPGTDIT